MGLSLLNKCPGIGCYADVVGRAASVELDLGIDLGVEVARNCRRAVVVRDAYRLLNTCCNVSRNVRCGRSVVQWLEGTLGKVEGIGPVVASDIRCIQGICVGGDVAEPIGDLHRYRADVIGGDQIELEQVARRPGGLAGIGQGRCVVVGYRKRDLRNAEHVGP